MPGIHQSPEPYDEPPLHRWASGVGLLAGAELLVDESLLGRGGFLCGGLKRCVQVRDLGLERVDLRLKIRCAGYGGVSWSRGALRRTGASTGLAADGLKV